jgi:DNA processing protein
MHPPTLCNAKRDWGPILQPVHAAPEVGAYEILWTEPNASFKILAKRFAGSPGARP